MGPKTPPPSKSNTSGQPGGKFITPQSKNGLSSFLSKAQTIKTKSIAPGSTGKNSSNANAAMVYNILRVSGAVQMEQALRMARDLDFSEEETSSLMESSADAPYRMVGIYSVRSYHARGWQAHADIVIHGVANPGPHAWKLVSRSNLHGYCTNPPAGVSTHFFHCCSN
jgi:hypothetical protein